MEDLREGNAQVKQFLVEKGDEVVFLPQDTVSDVMSIELGGSSRAIGSGIGGQCRERVLFTDSTNSADNLWPGDCLDIGLDDSIYLSSLGARERWRHIRLGFAADACRIGTCPLIA